MEEAREPEDYSLEERIHSSIRMRGVLMETVNNVFDAYLNRPRDVQVYTEEVLYCTQGLLSTSPYPEEVAAVKKLRAAVRRVHSAKTSADVLTLMKERVTPAVQALYALPVFDLATHLEHLPNLVPVAET